MVSLLPIIRKSINCQMMYLKRWNPNIPLVAKILCSLLMRLKKNLFLIKLFLRCFKRNKVNGGNLWTYSSNLSSFSLTNQPSVLWMRNCSSIWRHLLKLLVIPMDNSLIYLGYLMLLDIPVWTRNFCSLVITLIEGNKALKRYVYY